MKKLILLLNVLIGCHGIAQSFSELDSLKESYFTIRFDKKISTIVNKKIDHPEEGYWTQDVITTRLNKNIDETIIVEFDPGPSDDPGFVFYRENKTNKQREYINQVNGDELIITHNGFFYTKTASNNMFVKRSKFQYDGKTITETPQAFYYVGLQTITLKPFTLYSDTKCTKAVANIPKNYQVEVLVNTEDLYLLKTPFGLTGWVKIPSSQTDESYDVMQGTGIKGLFFRGD